MWFKVRTTVLVCLHFAEQQLSADDALRKHVAIRVRPSAWLLFNVADYDQRGRLRFLQGAYITLSSMILYRRGAAVTQCCQSSISNVPASKPLSVVAIMSSSSSLYFSLFSICTVLQLLVTCHSWPVKGNYGK